MSSCPYENLRAISYLAVNTSGSGSGSFMGSLIAGSQKCRSVGGGSVGIFNHCFVIRHMGREDVLPTSWACCRKWQL